MLQAEFTLYSIAQTRGFSGDIEKRTLSCTTHNLDSSRYVIDTMLRVVMLRGDSLDLLVLSVVDDTSLCNSM